MRSDKGCWTCRLRRKKCDEHHPVCEACATLRITCHYSEEKPTWMDRGAGQQEMARRIKRQIREQGARSHPHRRMGRASRNSDAMLATSCPGPAPGEYLATPVVDVLPVDSVSYAKDYGAIEQQQPVTGSPSLSCPLVILDGPGGRESGNPGAGWPDACLFMFYLDNLMPFLFPFYRPSLAQGGRSWILDVMMTSPVVRQMALCQSSYFFSLALGTGNCHVAWERLLAQSKDAFETLRRSLQALDGRTDNTDTDMDLCEVVRILAGVVQLQRFETSVSNFENYHAHRTAAVALFRRVLDSATGTTSSFDAVMGRLGTSSWRLPSQCIQVPSAEQAACKFSAGLVILDDIIASTTLQEKPTLYEYHGGLLSGTDGSDPPIDLEPLCGCQNSVLLQISEIAALDAWKQERTRAGDLDVVELVSRATPVKDVLMTRVTRLEAAANNITTASGASKRASGRGPLPLDFLFPAYPYHGDEAPAHTISEQTALITRIWAHAALAYLSVVLSGWQPSSSDIRHHISRIIELLPIILTPQQHTVPCPSPSAFSPALLRTMVWPFCVAGCLAQSPEHHARLRKLVEQLQPSSVFGTVYKALGIMEGVWRRREVGDGLAPRDLAACFAGHGEVVVVLV
ncbi:hypothetical protein AYO20_02795 [Fonsecaea nubica]|uniref:Zn(2)-C6 fungal-type domain-containing protein n=1 Tax=Fonsecaea nubica TaxID=856822 RepID=A0A178D8P9_9EURO|nr:hypothetical protein AYO20_02795 [Fonsecaea nubica]OAL37962.1 hypothetical protein AYO20_02795 [Fonsecaea nubica]